MNLYTVAFITLISTCLFASGCSDDLSDLRGKSMKQVLDKMGEPSEKHEGFPGGTSKEHADKYPNAVTWYYTVRGDTVCVIIDVYKNECISVLVFDKDVDY